MQKYHFIHEGSTYLPLAIEDVMSVWCGDIKKTVGFNKSPCFHFYLNGTERMYSLEKNYQKIVNFVFRKINTDKKYAKKIRKEFDRRQKKIFDLIEYLNKVDWRNINNKELIRIKKDYTRLYHWFTPFGEPLPYFLKEKLWEALSAYLLGELKITPSEYEILTLPAYQSFLSREEAELYEITKKYSFSSVEFSKQIEKHAQKYQWLLFDYASLIVDENYFIEKAREFLKKPPALIDYKKLGDDKKKLIQKYKINKFNKYYIDLIDDLIYLMDKKKEVFTQLHFAVLPLFDEVGKRLGFSLDDIRWFLWDEVKDALSGKRKLTKEALLRHKEFSAIRFNNGKANWADEKELKVLLKEINEDQKMEEEVSEIKGVGVSRGIVRGRVRYLKSPQENNKIKQGEILVTGNTTPDYMPAIRRAAGIVTNSGGITCHAAIVSRELGIPCIVGTKIATRVLKNGDLIEVDADEGIVRIL